MMDIEALLKEFSFRTSRSSGKGGQHVNKVSTKVEVIFNVANSMLLSNDEKEKILAGAGKHGRDDGTVFMICSEGRSQYLNKKKAIEKIIRLLEKCLAPVKSRVPTAVPDEEKEKRMAEKKKTAEKKRQRKNNPEDQF
ncbi:MAG TPA: alternative ribosome rescue aminoacyl-tRNA hydrolase ArfB [Bacteroidales bacterium]|nr:aminoacyl-tRNA hydrolase [Bacteroidales bacterium]HNZ42623.1 alternative ribosome rescue aminoacyl-tRNA hydrolase ArfB [Bacteroidales bacterium]HOH83578.1 alternative ribosome rescue aminoacyl-tRNA hydrolase ArfB [Bacteroidales bacterium]HPB26225.1 alternative ribosome rescue aminoacyl-tRNA hydrolase ArfB [Bacteroidales bacterium]HPI30825.1 alternative ribosome rescue aminoacyl-tRNA hydrolase ArfB [Bacteroidales bacterium]